MDNKYSIDQLIGFIVGATILGILVLVFCGIPIPDKVAEALLGTVVIGGMAALMRAAN